MSVSHYGVILAGENRQNSRFQGFLSNVDLSKSMKKGQSVQYSGLFFFISILIGSVFFSTCSETAVPPKIRATRNCNYYASPTGAGDGLSPAKPFRVVDFWAVAGPGQTLCLLDGTYIGDDAMIDPPDNLKGTSENPIVIRALEEGKVLLDGAGTRVPLNLYLNDWFVIEGVNACCSNGSVVQVFHSNHDIIRRVTGWDAADSNTSIFDIRSGEHNLLEDVAGWGVARKVFSSSQAGNFTTIRRAWGRWEGSHVIGPKMTYTFAYNNYDMLAENILGTWSGERQKESYVLLDYKGQPWTGNGEGTKTKYEVDQPYGIFAMDRLDDKKESRVRLLGSLAYVRSGDRFQPQQLVFFTKIDSVHIENILAYIQPRAYPHKNTLKLLSPGEQKASDLRARNVTGIGGAGADIAADWQVSNFLQSSPGQEAFPSGENIFSSGRGANLCFRYHDGVLTNEPLWPWPMNQRILDATRQSGREPVDVTATIEQMFGRIPEACRAGSLSQPHPGSLASKK